MTRDPYVDPASGVLRNRLGISDQAALDAAEADYTAVRAAALGGDDGPLRAMLGGLVHGA